MAKAYHHGDLKMAAVQKAADIIQAKRGVDFTLREVAGELNVSHTAVYRHFESKQELLSHVAEQGFRLLGEGFAAGMDQKKTARQKLKAAGRAYIQFAVKNPGYYRCMFHYDLHDCDVQRPELNEVQRVAFASLIDVIEEGIARKEFVKVEPMVAARTIWAGVHGFSVLVIDNQFASVKSAKDRTDAIENHLSLLEQSILA